MIDKILFETNWKRSKITETFYKCNNVLNLEINNWNPGKLVESVEKWRREHLRSAPFSEKY